MNKYQDPHSTSAGGGNAPICCLPTAIKEEEEEEEEAAVIGGLTQHWACIERNHCAVWNINNTDEVTVTWN